ncbi:Calcyclin-binding protein-like protein [Drosera capensis]
MADEASLDLDELRHLQGIAKRPRVLSLISSEIAHLEKLSKASSSVPQTPIVPLAKVASVPALKYTTLATFSWDQDNDKVKIYVPLEGVQEEKIETSFKSSSFDIKFHDVQGKNYQFAIPKLNKSIVPEKCKILVKPTRVVITLIKDSRGNWSDLHFKEDKLKSSLDKDKDKDPMAGIMDLMKNMYEEGDEEMKKTIAKAWTDARSGKTTDSLRGLR